MSLSREITIGNQTVSVPITVVDQIVNFVSPKLGQERFKIRAQMAMVGGYSAADRTRPANRLGSRRETDADGAILPDLRVLREESQHMLRNSAIAVGAVKTNVTKVVGTGLKVKPQICRETLKLDEEAANKWEREALREFLLATDTREIDAERQLTFSLLQGLVLLKTLEDGDVFTSMPRFKRPGSPYQLKLQIIEAARVGNPNNAVFLAGTTAGVEKDATGAPVAYHVCNQHPYGMRHSAATPLKWQRLDAFGKNTGAPQVLHHYDKTRPGQTRGVPYLAPICEVIKQLGRYTDAEVSAAVTSGYLTAFITTESGDAGQVFNGQPVSGGQSGTGANRPVEADFSLGDSTVVGLLPGESITALNPSRPNPAFDPFVTALCRQIGVALEIPFELLVKHFTASYSAARAALLEAWAYFNRRRHWLATSFCQPVYEAVITEAVATGRLKAPGFFSDPAIRRAYLGTVWTGDAPGQIDPLKEVNAAEKRMALNLTTHDEECTALPYGGSSWEGKFPQLVKEKKMLREAGLDDAKALPTPPEAIVPDEDDTDLENEDPNQEDPEDSAMQEAVEGIRRDVAALSGRQSSITIHNHIPVPGGKTTRKTVTHNRDAVSGEIISSDVVEQEE